MKLPGEAVRLPVGVPGPSKVGGSARIGKRTGCNVIFGVGTIEASTKVEANVKVMPTSRGNASRLCMSSVTRGTAKQGGFPFAVGPQRCYGALCQR